MEEFDLLLNKSAADDQVREDAFVWLPMMPNDAVYLLEKCIKTLAQDSEDVCFSSPWRLFRASSRAKTAAQLMAVCGADHDVPLQPGLGDLAGDVGIGGANDHPVRGCCTCSCPGRQDASEQRSRSFPRASCET